MPESGFPSPRQVAALDAARRLGSLTSLNDIAPSTAPSPPPCRASACFAPPSTSTPICAVYRSVWRCPQGQQAPRARRRASVRQPALPDHLGGSPRDGPDHRASPTSPTCARCSAWTPTKIAGWPPPPFRPARLAGQRAPPGLGVSALLPVMDALLRLARLLDAARHIGARPLHERGSCCRLLTGEQGPRLRAIAAADSQGPPHCPRRCVDQENFDQPCRSTPGRHRQHEQIVAASSLQVAHRDEPAAVPETDPPPGARKLMLLESIDAATVARRVGYEAVPIQPGIPPPLRRPRLCATWRGYAEPKPQPALNSSEMMQDGPHSGAGSIVADD